MKTKTIKKIIETKFNDFVDSITDDNTQLLVRKNSMITGGCIASMFRDEKVNDFDIYFTNKETVLAVANYYAKQSIHQATVVDVDLLDYRDKEFYAEHGIFSEGRIAIYCEATKQASTMPQDEDQEMINIMLGSDESKPLPEEIKDTDNNTKYKLQYISPNAITLSHKIQLIIRFYGSPEQIHENYDFIHCTNYWLSNNDQGKPELVLKQAALESILTKELRYIGSKYPLASLLRVKKFLLRGWTITAGQQLKMMYQVSELDLNDIPTLEDQLVGVDVAYFMALVQALRNMQKAHEQEIKTGTFKIDQLYLFSLIDRIFS